jgi:hypothetical protein
LFIDGRRRGFDGRGLLLRERERTKRSEDDAEAKRGDDGTWEVWGNTA